MAAFLIATTTVKDAEKFKRYAEQVVKTFALYGGEPLLRGNFEGMLGGEGHHQMAGVVKFPSIEALRTWFYSPEYQSIIPLRTEAVDMSIATYSVPD
ncbi:MAG: DUF1330 domain-containing protein [Porticoccaceae bacterium]|jgi:uncharacterized protein (DUF1330 family)|nr:DUF1330 domain-containing protein [Porticoccaceae bacterium]